MAEVSGLRGLTTLLAVGVLAGLLVSTSDELSRDRIIENDQRYLLRSLAQVVSPEAYDNDLASSSIQIINPELTGDAAPTNVYVGTLNGQPSVFIFSVTAPDGYNGPIRLLVGISRDGTITGVRAVSHRETPGLGDAIELGRSDWVLGFTGRSLADPPPAGWGVRTDGGQFDQLTGATITPRAVVKAVRNTLVYFQRERDPLVAEALASQH
jgi:electron transport complex protein RnfG